MNNQEIIQILIHQMKFIIKEIQIEYLIYHFHQHVQIIVKYQMVYLFEQIHAHVVLVLLVEHI